MGLIKTKEEIEILRESGKRLAEIMRILAVNVKAGGSSADLDKLAFEEAKKGGDTPSFLNYRAHGSANSYPASLCVSVNDVIVHGIPNVKPVIFKAGDIVSLDMGLTHKGMVTDHAVSVVVGEMDQKTKKLISVTERALYVGIDAAIAGKRAVDIGIAIEKYVRGEGYGLAEELGGHGVGNKVHEDPFIPNFKIAGNSPKLKEGMVIAIEPMVIESGSDRVIFEKDGYTVRTADGSRAAHFEHTILITDKDAEILTK